MLRHIVITRFNLPTPGREAPLRAMPGWLDGRIDLFARFCLPGMAQQQCQDFDWAVFMDEATPQPQRDRMAALAGVRPFMVIHAGHFASRGWADLLRQHLIGDCQPGRWLLTSNLDNDDALASDYTARLRAAARLRISAQTLQGRFALNLTEGFVRAGSRLYRHHHGQNAFTTLAEPDDPGFATTMTIRHMELADHVPVVQVGGGPGWMQVVHGGNVSNRVRGVLVDPGAAQGRFPAEALAGLEPPRRSELLIDHVVRAPWRFLRDRAFALARRILPADRG